MQTYQEANRDFLSILVDTKKIITTCGVAGLEEEYSRIYDMIRGYAMAAAFGTEMEFISENIAELEGIKHKAREVMCSSFGSRVSGL